MMMIMIMIMTIVSVEQRPGWGEHVYILYCIYIYENMPNCVTPRKFRYIDVLGKPHVANSGIVGMPKLRLREQMDHAKRDLTYTVLVLVIQYTHL